MRRILIIEGYPQFAESLATRLNQDSEGIPSTAQRRSAIASAIGEDIEVVVATDIIDAAEKLGFDLKWQERDGSPELVMTQKKPCSFDLVLLDDNLDNFPNVGIPHIAGKGEAQNSQQINGEQFINMLIHVTRQSHLHSLPTIIPISSQPLWVDCRRGNPKTENPKLSLREKGTEIWCELIAEACKKSLLKNKTLRIFVAHDNSHTKEEIQAAISTAFKPLTGRQAVDVEIHVTDNLHERSEFVASDLGVVDLAITLGNVNDISELGAQLKENDIRKIYSLEDLRAAAATIARNIRMTTNARHT